MSTLWNLMARDLPQRSGGTSQRSLSFPGPSDDEIQSRNEQIRRAPSPVSLRRAAGDILQVIADSRVDMEGRMRGMLGFLFYSSIALAPVLIAVSVAGHFLRRDRLIGLARLAVVIGFLAGGGVGWASVPAQWSASLWTTIEAAGDSARYGESFEHTAERALMYLFFFALLGEVAFGLAALVVLRRMRNPPSAQP